MKPKAAVILILVLLAWPALSQAQVMALKGTSSDAFSIGYGANKRTFTNSAGTLSLDGALSIASGTVSFTTVDIDGGTIDGVALGGSSASTGAFTAMSATGQITSTLSTGTAPLSIASTTLVSNLNVDQVDGMGLVAGSDGGLAYQSSSSQVSFSAAGTTGQFMASGGATAPTWAGLASASVFVGNGSNIPTPVALSGDATLDSSGVMTIGSGAITGAEIAADAVTAAMIQQGTAGQVFMSNATPQSAWVTVTGDLTATGAGAFAIANNAVKAAQINNSEIDAAKLADAVADEILTASLAAGSETANTITCTLQVKDAQGNNLSGTFLVHWNIDDSDVGVGETALSVTVSYTNGAEWQQLTEHKKAVAFTDSTGKLEIDVTHIGANTIYLMCAVGGKVSSVTLTFS